MKLANWKTIIFAAGLGTFGMLFAAADGLAQSLYPDFALSRPTSGGAPVSLQKGQRGLWYHFTCLDAANNASNVCFPLGKYDAAGRLDTVHPLGLSATVTLSATANPCTEGTSPGPGQCSFALVDALNKGSICVSPIPPHNPDYPCLDTVVIYYGGQFTDGASLNELVSGAGAYANGANLTQLTCNDGPSPPPNTAPCRLNFSASKLATVPPVSIELVFDTSGSMSCSSTSTNCPAGSGEIQRIQALKLAGQTFFSTLNSYAIKGDKLGVSFFNTNADPDPFAPMPCGGPGTNLKPAEVPANVNFISGKVSGASPGGWTTIGGGLQSAFTCGFAADLTGNANREILLFSDGEQNTPPLVKLNGSQIQLSDKTGTVYSNYPAGNNPGDIHICPVTAGRLTAVGYGLQQQIAVAACNGNNAHVRDSDANFVGADLESFFAQSLSVILPTDKLELVSDTIGTVVHGGTTIEKYLGNSNDLSTSIGLSWTGSSEQDFLSLRLRAPDGSLIDLANRTVFGNNHSFTTILFPIFRGPITVPQKGQWQIELDGGKLRSPQVSYHMVVMSDNPTIASEFRLDAQDVGTGEPIALRVKLTDGGSPVLNATVQALLEGPQNSQGSILSTTPATIGPSSGPDAPSTKGQAKLQALLANPVTASLFGDQILPTLSLFDNGNIANGDVTANDGVYSGLFKNDPKEGHYYFAIRVRGTSTAGDFQRAFRLTEFVRSKPDPAQTNLQVVSSVTQPNGSVLVTLSAAPHDSFGNFLGPGYEKDMQITSSIGTVQTPFDDILDGSYRITYSLPSPVSNPTIGVVILGQPVVSIPLHDIPGAGGGPGFSNGKWAVSFHLGVTIPHGSLSAFSPSVSLGGDLEYRLPHGVSLETYVGFDHFRSGLGDTHFVNLSERGKVTFGSGTLRPFAFFGVGGYFASGGNNYAGVNTGVGLQYWLKHRFAIEGTYTFHNVFVTGGNAQYSTLLGGVRYVFK